MAPRLERRGAAAPRGEPEMAPLHFFFSAKKPPIALPMAPILVAPTMSTARKITSPISFHVPKGILEGT